MGLTLQNISHRFGQLLAVDDASLAVQPGEIVCLFGPSGCGKTTLLRIAAGLEPIQSGAIKINDQILAKPGAETPPEKRPIGFVFQDFVLFPHMTVSQNLAFGLTSRGKEAKKHITAQLEAMDLSGLGGRYPHELSGGQQQRTALARALIRNPSALLLDEPFASIDSVLRRRLRDDLRRVLKRQNVAVILVTHDPDEALALGDRIAFMRSGRIVDIGSPEELFRTPQSADGAKIFPGSQVLDGIVKNQKIDTPIGSFDCPDLSDGAGVIVIRSDALTAEADPDGAFRTFDVRFSPQGWEVSFVGNDLSAPLRVILDDKPNENASYRLYARADMVFTFKKQ